MSKYIAILPYVYQPYLDACVATMHPDFKKNVLFVDNTDLTKNYGVMASHNIGVRALYERDKEWLVVLSPAVRFGPSGGMRMIELLDQYSDHYIIHGGSDNILGGRQQVEGSENDPVNRIFGMHQVAIHRKVFDAVGKYDPNLSLYGMDDLDLSLRVQKSFKGAPGWNTYSTDTEDTTMSHSINLAGIESPYEPRNNYFQAKWGRTGSEWQSMGYEHPFNQEENGLGFYPEPPDPRSLAHGYWDRVWASERTDLSTNYVKA